MFSLRHHFLPHVTFYLTVSPDPSMQSTDSVLAMYRWCAVPRGVCLIINNMDFSQARGNGHEAMHDREGSEVDSSKLSRCLLILKVFLFDSHK